MKDFKLVTGTENSVKHLVVDYGQGKYKTIANIVTKVDGRVTIENIDTEYGEDIVKLVEEALKEIRKW